MSSSKQRIEQAHREQADLRARMALCTFVCDDEDEFRWFESAEEGTVLFIKKYLRTEEQRAWLFAQDLSLEDVLNGRTTIVQSEFLRNVIFYDWNTKLGRHVFGF